MGELSRLQLPNVNLEDGFVMVHGKGGKDRYVPIGRVEPGQQGAHLRGDSPASPRAGAAGIPARGRLHPLALQRRQIDQAPLTNEEGSTFVRKSENLLNGGS